MHIEAHKPIPNFDPAPCNFDPQILPELILQQQLAKEKGENPPYHLIQGKKIGTRFANSMKILQ
ncbi:MAG: hypothetical protein H0T62_06820 [Parachlamydiaceae bacterium]|nr:hypothetical protein [Parachlamydiaceae bacterium]